MVPMRGTEAMGPAAEMECILTTAKVALVFVLAVIFFISVDCSGQHKRHARVGLGLRADLRAYTSV